jgi:hypothetical protein
MQQNMNNNFDGGRKSSYHHTPYASQAQALRNNHYLVPDNMAGLAHGFSSLGLNSNYNASNPRSFSTANPDYSVQGPVLYTNPAIYAHQPLMASAGNANGSNLYGHVHTPYLQAPHYDSKFMQQYSSENTGTGSWSSRADGHRISSDASQNTVTTVPTLITPRRGSVSSTEDHLPSTPYGGYGQYTGDVAIMGPGGKSPSAFGTNTPSPSSYIPGFVGHSLKQPSAYQTPVAISHQLQELIQREPPMPRAIPAPSSPLKPLDRALEVCSFV